MLRAFERLQLLDRGAERASAADGDHDRVQRLQPLLHVGRARLGDAEAAGGGGRVARHDFAELQSELFGEPRREIHAMRDRMVEPDLDQPLRHGHRDQPLRGLARHAELLGDLVLGVAGDVIEPAGARRIVEPVAVRLDLERLVARAVNAVLHDISLPMRPRSGRPALP